MIAITLPIGPKNRASTYVLLTLSIFWLASSAPLEADAVFLTAKEQKTPIEAIVTSAHGPFLEFYRLDRGKFVVSSYDQPIDRTWDKASAEEDQAIIRRWISAGCTATVTPLNGPKKTLCNCDFRYVPPKGTFIIGGRNILPNDQLTLKTATGEVLVKFEEADRITVARDGILSVILRNGILVMGMPLPNGLLRPTFHGVQNFLGPAQRDFVDFEFSNISEIQFAKRAASLAAAAVPLKPAERESLHMGIPVIVIADTPLWSHGKVVRFAQKGEILSVASYARGNTVELIDRNKRGDRLQVTASCDAIALTVPQT